MATINFISSKSQSRGSLGRVIKYVEQDEKTLMKNGIKLVSGQACFPQLAFREFNATREAHRKTSPVWFYHYTQSFHPKEKVTPELAHRIAKEFAEQAWPENEVLIATHIDAAHIHSHFIVNAVCHESGKMLRQGPNTLQQLRDLSDQLCLKFDLSVLPKNHKRKGREPDRREYRAAVKGQSWKLRLMNTIDDGMRYAGDREEFIRLMQSEGGRRQYSLRAHGCNYVGETTARSCPFNYFTRQDLLQLALDLKVHVPEIYGEIVREPDGTLRTTKAQRTGCSMCGFGIHMDARPHHFDLLREQNPREWEFWMYRCCTDPETGEKYGWGRVLDWIGVGWENQYDTDLVGQISFFEAPLKTVHVE